ncbi:MAG: hypothetical protein R3A45_09030 [Bdellovibrionota bacterium]
MKLHNIHSREELIKKRAAETFHRKACSFYRYIHIENPQTFRNHLYLAWYPLGVLGRIYVSYEGINAQLCVPEYQWDHFADSLSLFPETQDMFINEALTEGDQLFKIRYQGERKNCRRRYRWQYFCAKSWRKARQSY